MKKSELKRIIKESIRSVIQEDLRSLVADQLVNVADEGGFKNAKDFAKQIGSMPMGSALDPKYAEKIYNAYMSLNPNERMRLGTDEKAMHKFLAKFGLK